MANSPVVVANFTTQATAEIQGVNSPVVVANFSTDAVTFFNSSVVTADFTTNAAEFFNSSVVVAEFSTEALAVPTVFGPATMVSEATVVLTVEHFTSPISSVTIGGIDVSSSIVLEGATVTVDVPDMFATGLAQAVQVVEVGDGIDTANVGVELVAPAGWYYVTLTGYAHMEGETWIRDLDAAVVSMADDAVLQLVDGNELWYLDAGADLTVDAQGVASMDAALAPATFSRMAFFPGFVGESAGPDGIYSEMADWTIATTMSGSMVAVEEGADTFTGAGVRNPAGSLSVREVGFDIASGVGTVEVVGAAAAEESGFDIFRAQAFGSISLTLSTQESGADVFAGDGFLSAPDAVTGSFFARESGVDSLQGVGYVVVSVQLTAQESSKDLMLVTAFAPPPDLFTSFALQESGEDVVRIFGRTLEPGLWSITGPVVSGWNKEPSL